MIYSAAVLGHVFLDRQQPIQSELNMALAIKFSNFNPEQTAESVYYALLVELFAVAELKGEFIFNYHHQLKGAGTSRGIPGMVFKKKGKRVIEVTVMPDGTNIKMVFLVNCPKPDDIISRLKAAQAKLRDEEVKRASERKAAKEMVSGMNGSPGEDREKIETKIDEKEMVVSASDVEVYRQLIEDNQKKIAAVEVQESAIASDHHDRLQIHCELKQGLDETKDEILGFEEMVSGLERQITDLRLKLEDAKRNCIIEREKRERMEEEDREHVRALTSMRAQMNALSGTKRQLEKECSDAKQEIGLFEAEQERSAQAAIELMRAALENLPPERREHVLRQYSLQSVGV